MSEIRLPPILFEPNPHTEALLIALRAYMQHAGAPEDEWLTFRITVKLAGESLWADGIYTERAAE